MWLSYVTCPMSGTWSSITTSRRLCCCCICLQCCRMLSRIRFNCWQLHSRCHSNAVSPTPGAFRTGHWILFSYIYQSIISGYLEWTTNLTVTLLSTDAVQVVLCSKNVTQGVFCTLSSPLARVRICTLFFWLYCAIF